MLLTVVREGVSPACDVAHVADVEQVRLVRETDRSDVYREVRDGRLQLYYSWNTQNIILSNVKFQTIKHCETWKIQSSFYYQLPIAKSEE